MILVSMKIQDGNRNGSSRKNPANNPFQSHIFQPYPHTKPEPLEDIGCQSPLKKQSSIVSHTKGRTCGSFSLIIPRPWILKMSCCTKGGALFGFDADMSARAALGPKRSVSSKSNFTSAVYANEH